MRFYFQVKGNFKNRNISNTFFDYISFTANGEDYVLDLTGELDAEFGNDFINGRIKCDEINTLNEHDSKEDIKKAILKMNESTFELAIVNSDVDDYIKYDSIICEIWIDDIIKKVNI